MIESYVNELGDLILVVNEQYIIIDKHDLNPQCIMYTEKEIKKYIDAGYKKDKGNIKRQMVGYCECSNMLYEGNRIKIRDYFECPKCNKISTRQDLQNN